MICWWSRSIRSHYHHPITKPGLSYPVLLLNQKGSFSKHGSSQRARACGGYGLTNCGILKQVYKICRILTLKSISKNQYFVTSNMNIKQDSRDSSPKPSSNLLDSLCPNCSEYLQASQPSISAQHLSQASHTSISAEHLSQASQPSISAEHLSRASHLSISAEHLNQAFQPSISEMLRNAQQSSTLLKNAKGC